MSEFSGAEKTILTEELEEEDPVAKRELKPGDSMSNSSYVVPE